MSVSKDTKGHSASTQASTRYVVLKYWYNEGVSGIGAIESSIDLLNAFAIKTPDAQFQFPPRMYAVIFTPALGIQHLSPKPRLIVFAENCEPAFATDKVADQQLCCSPPEQKLDLAAGLRPLGSGPQKGEPEDDLLKILAKTDGLSWSLLWGQDVTDQDRLMVYRVLERKLAELKKARPADASLERAQQALRNQIDSAVK